MIPLFQILEGDTLKIEISFINVDFPFKRVAFTSTSKLLLCVLFLKNTAQNNPYPEVAYFRVACFDPLDTTLWGKESGILRDFR